MKHPELKAAIEKLNAKRASLKNTLDVARDESGEVDPEKVNLPSGSDFRDWFIAQNKELEDLHADVEAKKTFAAVADEAFADPMALESIDGPVTAQQVRSFGDVFAESAAYQNRTGSIGPQSTLQLDVRNTLFQRTAGHAPESTRTGYVDLSPQRPLAVLDLIPTMTTSQSSEKFMRETTFTPTNIVEKAESATFGEAALALTEVVLPVEKIPAWLPVTDEQLEDVDGIREYIDGRLTYMVRRRLDGQIVAGDGSTPNLEGTENVTGIQTQALGADTTADAAFKLFTKIMDDADGATAGGDAEPSAFIIRAAKWQAVQLERTTDGIYIWGSPSEANRPVLWGVPGVLSNAVTATKLVAGDYAQHSYLKVKRDVDVQISNSHSDFFINGKQAIRADVRVVMVHLRPSAFGEVTGL